MVVGDALRSTLIALLACYALFPALSRRWEQVVLRCRNVAILGLILEAAHRRWRMMRRRIAHSSEQGKDTKPPTLSHVGSEEPLLGGAKSLESSHRPAVKHDMLFLGARELAAPKTSVASIDPRPADILVYNISHADLYLSYAERGKGEPRPQLARPGFNQFGRVGRSITEFLRHEADQNGFNEKLESKAANGTLLPIGFKLDMPQSLSGFRTRGSHREASPRSPGVVFEAVYLPLLAMILPRWIDVAHNRSGGGCEGRRVVYLVSGASTPRNSKDSPEENSTYYTACLAQTFIEAFFPEVRVQIVNSGNDILHYEDNVRFVLHTLRPYIEKERRTLLGQFGDDWPDHLHLTLSLGGGAPARVAAINAGLRCFKPDWLHVWQPKRFWHDFLDMSPISERDIEHHCFFDTELIPATPAQHLPLDECLLVRKMVEHRDQFLAAWLEGPHNDNELRKFWVRKTKQPVLSVLMTQRPGLPPKFYYGVNMEVSMPTGSLCAERNAISSALAADASICRGHFRMVAVLSIPDFSKVKPTAPQSPQSPRSPTLDALDGLSRASSLPSVDTESSGPLEDLLLPDPEQKVQVTCNASAEIRPLPASAGSTGSSSTLPPQNGAPAIAEILTGKPADAPLKVETEVLELRGGRLQSLSLPSPRQSPTLNPKITAAKLMQGAQGATWKDNNPLEPCGACSEWLRKIAEVNPDFKVVTFSAVDCSQAYVKTFLT